LESEHDEDASHSFKRRRGAIFELLKATPFNWIPISGLHLDYVKKEKIYILTQKKESIFIRFINPYIRDRFDTKL